MKKIILITGSSSGIGKATAIKFAKEGYDIIINYLNNKKGANETVLEIQKLGSKAIAIQSDITIEKEAERLVNEAIKEFKTLDILVNNAGGYIDGDEWNGPSSIWQDTFNKNILSTLNVSKYVIPIFQKDKKGIIINISSRHGSDGQPDAISYSASKAAIINITQSLAKLLVPFGRANAISPGPVNTGYWLTAEQREIDEYLASIPLKDFLKTEEVANMIYYLCSDSARMITGQNLCIDGGYSSIK